jgi:hypothetical protein
MNLNSCELIPMKRKTPRRFGFASDTFAFANELLLCALFADDSIDDWKFGRSIGKLWRLHNPRTGETLSGEFFP